MSQVTDETMEHLARKTGTHRLTLSDGVYDDDRIRVALPGMEG